jgi:hypothetical protein
MASLPFDPLLFKLENYYYSNLEEFNRIHYELKRDVYAPLYPLVNEKISRENISKKLLARVAYAEGLAKTICQRHDLNFWMSISRRYPQVLLPSFGWKAINQNLLLKYSSAENKETINGIIIKGREEVGLAFEEDELLDVYRECLLASLINHLFVLNRGITKGGKLGLDGNEIICVSNTELQTAFNSYDRRYTYNFILSYLGVPVDRDGDENRPIYESYTLFGFIGSQPLYCPKLNFTLNLVNHRLTKFSLIALEKVLLSYEDALIECYGIDTICIIQFLYALSMNMANTMPALTSDENGALIYPFGPEDQENYQKLGFYFGLLTKGYIRFPYDYLVRAIGRAPYKRASQQEAERRAARFLMAFARTSESWNDIEIGALSAYPFVYRASSWYYLDFTFLENFLFSIIQRCKDLYAAQHGDRFSLLVRQYIRQHAPGVLIVPHDAEVMALSFVDLIVIKDGIVYCIECKAYAKSKEYLMGSVKSFNARNKLIREATKQAIANCYKAEQSGLLNEYKIFEWVLCTSSQEFLNPVSKYGMLSQQIPKVCTIEELALFLSGHEI